MTADVLLLLALILVNGIFAMSEIAVVSSKAARLQRMAAGGHGGATAALTLAADPTRFLSTVQVGITSVGILSGAIGEVTVAARLSEMFATVPLLAPYAHGLAVGMMVIGLTYVSLIVGELVPKRLALMAPERIASVVARPMQVIASVGRPLVHLLSASTDGILRLVGARKSAEPAVSLDEIKGLMEQGTEEGVFERTEQEMVTNVLDLDARRVWTVVTPRADIVYLDVAQPFEEHRQRLAEAPHSIVPLCEGGLDHVIGLVRSKDVLAQIVRDRRVDLTALASPPLFVPRTLTLMQLLQHFRQAKLPVALVVDEHGEVEGLVSLTDVFASIVGELPETAGGEPAIVRRSDGSVLMDGALPWADASRAIGRPGWLPGPESVETLGGFVMLRLGRVPRTGDVFHQDGFRFEVVDMDGNRIDKVLVSAPPQR